MKTLIQQRRTLSAGRRFRAAEVAIAIRRRVGFGDAVAGHSSEVDPEHDWQTVALLAHLATLLALLFVVGEGVLASFVIEHGAILLAGALLFFSPARQLGKILLRVVLLAGAVALPVWILFALKFCH